MIDLRRQQRQDTYDLRDQLQDDQHMMQGHIHGEMVNYTSDEEHSVLEDDSDDGANDDGDYILDDDSSSLSIPNESIDFDMVYSLTNFAATVEGQASVVKGDSLYLMDDSNSYWWLVRVLKTQEVGYIPAENIETPFERLARLNRHRNIDLASATQAELQEGANQSRENLRAIIATRAGSPSVTGQRTDSRLRARRTKSVIFTPSSYVFRYPPAVWNEDDEDEIDDWDEDDIEIGETPLRDDSTDPQEDEMAHMANVGRSDDGMQWEPEQDMRGMGPSNVSRNPFVDPPVSEEQGVRFASSENIYQPQGGATDSMQGEGQLRRMNSRERMFAQQQQEEAERRVVSPSSASGRSPTQALQDPAQATDTRKLTVTPPVARDAPAGQQQRTQNGPLLPSDIVRQGQPNKRGRDEVEAEDPRRRQKGKEPEIHRTPSIETRSSASSSSGGKLIKSRDSDEDTKKKSSKPGGLLNRLGFGRKDKNKDKQTSLENIAAAADAARASEDSGVSSSNHSHYQTSPTENGRGSGASGSSILRQQQQVISSRNGNERLREIQGDAQSNASSNTSGSVNSSSTAQHSQHLLERDQQQQDRYREEYLKHSPSSPPNQPSYGLQSANQGLSPLNQAIALQASSSSRTPGGRPGSLILTNIFDGQGAGVPELNVIRIFAGRHIQSEATFKTVLLNNSTSAAELVKQAIQRFRLPAGENPADYYLTVKQVEGASAKLRPEEKPLAVFEELSEAAELDLPKVKRSSMGSISSIASNLSAHPAIKQLPMNDFTDDSAVKLYLNRRTEDGNDSITTEEDDTTLMANQTQTDDGDMSMASRSQIIARESSNNSNISPERFSSPSYKFALQLVIFPEDLPDNMVFDPLTEAIVFKDTLRDRPQSQSSTSTGVSQHMRKKVFNFPKNVTVAEVIEYGLDRFGIPEGVVDGGDEVEDKLTKRRSFSRVRYCLTVEHEGQVQELSPSSKVLDAYPRPPMFRRSGEIKRRSIDSTLLLGSIDDVQPDDPIFILRRAVTYKPTNSKRNSAPLDELEVWKMRHQHQTSASTDSSGTIQGPPNDAGSKQASRAEIIAAQRAASREAQGRLISQVNAHRGVDVVLPGKAVLRSSQYEAGGKMRYSYVQPDGEAYDISDIIEQEFKEDAAQRQGNGRAGQKQSGDLLQTAVSSSRPGASESLIDRVLNKISGRSTSPQAIQQSASGTTVSTVATTARSTSPSLYSLGEHDPERGEHRSTSALSNAVSQRTITPAEGQAQDAKQASRLRAPSPQNMEANNYQQHQRKQPSIASVISKISPQGGSSPSTPPSGSGPSAPKKITIPKDIFGISNMMAIIEMKASTTKPPRPQLDEVDQLLFGQQLDLNSVHPQIRDIYAGTFKKMEEINTALDDLLLKTMEVP